MDLSKLTTEMQKYVMAKRQAAGTVYIYQDIGPVEMGGLSAKAFADEVKALGPVDTLHIRINSVGGSVLEALAMFETIRTHPAKARIVYVDGLAASAASFVAMAGTRIIMAENAQMMVHQPWANGAGTAADHRRMADMLDRNEGMLVNIYSKRSGQDEDKVRAMLAAETWLNASEAVALGFADEVAADESKVAAKAVEMPKLFVVAAVTQRELSEADRILAEMEMTLLGRSLA